MTDWKYWVEEYGTECYSPIEIGEDGKATVVLGMIFMQPPTPPSRVVGKFWWGDDGPEIHIDTKCRDLLISTDDKKQPHAHTQGSGCEPLVALLIVLIAVLIFAQCSG